MGNFFGKSGTRLLPGKETTPVLFGVIIILFFWMIIGGNLMLLFYYENLSRTSSVKQIACPDQKLCVKPDEPQEYNYTVSIYFSNDFSDYTDDEEISIPYFKSYNVSTKSTYTITIDTTTTTVPSGGTKYLGLDDVGYANTSDSTLTIYIYGLTSYNDLSGIVPEIIREGIIQDDSDLRKISFFDVDTIPINGNNSLNFYILPGFADVGSNDLLVESNVSGSTILSGTESVPFTDAVAITTNSVVNTYNDYNYITQRNISRAFEGNLEDPTNEYTSCVDPGFISTSCDNYYYDTATAWWVPDGGDPSECQPATAAWGSFSKTTIACLKMCTPNRNLSIGPVIAGGTTANGAYQLNKVDPTIMDQILTGVDVGNLAYTYGIEDTPVDNANTFYEQSLVVCGGETNTENNYDGNALSPQDGVYPNPSTRAGGYTNLGF